MGNLFSGLEAFGLGKLTDINVYDEKEKEETNKTEKNENTFSEESIVFEKSYACPVCGMDFKSKTIKSGKAKLLSLDTDLRPRYQYVDPLKYDAVACPRCGYAALSRFFTHMTDTQASLIKSSISTSYKGIPESEGIMSYDDAIARHKLALVNAIVKKAKISERAYTCLKTAWVIRGKAESLSQDTPDYGKVIKALYKEEAEFIANAYDGFEEAFSKETFPMCGMDENTIILLVAELARRLGKLDEAGRWISRVLISRDASDRLKDRAREIKELIKK